MPDDHALPSPQIGQKPSLTRYTLIAAFLGLTWAVSLRAWMAMLAIQTGETPTMSWAGTFGAILIPAALMGAILGAAARDVQIPGSARWRWAVLSPLLLAIGPIVVLPGMLSALLTTGLGGGAVAVALVGVIGGCGFSGFGPRWVQWLCRGLLAAFAVAVAVAFFNFGQAPGAELGASQVFIVLMFLALMVLLVAGVASPSWFTRNRGPISIQSPEK